MKERIKKGLRELGLVALVWLSGQLIHIALAILLPGHESETQMGLTMLLTAGLLVWMACSTPPELAFFLLVGFAAWNAQGALLDLGYVRAWPRNCVFFGYVGVFLVANELFRRLRK